MLKESNKKSQLVRLEAIKTSRQHTLGNKLSGTVSKRKLWKCILACPDSLKLTLLQRGRLSEWLWELAVVATCWKDELMEGFSFRQLHTSAMFWFSQLHSDFHSVHPLVCFCQCLGAARSQTARIHSAYGRIFSCKDKDRSLLFSKSRGLGFKSRSFQKWQIMFSVFFAVKHNQTMAVCLEETRSRNTQFGKQWQLLKLRRLVEMLLQMMTWPVEQRTSRRPAETSPFLVPRFKDLKKEYLHTDWTFGQMNFVETLPREMYFSKLLGAVLQWHCRLPLQSSYVQVRAAVLTKAPCMTPRYRSDVEKQTTKFN